MIRKQSHSIIYPLLIWNGITCLFKLVVMKEERNLLTCIRTICQSYTDLWYLWSVLICSVLVPGVYYSCESKSAKVIGFGFVFVILLLIPDEAQPCKTMNIWMYPYFVLGFVGNYVRKKMESVIKIIYIQCVCIVLFPILLTFFHTQDYVYVSGINPFQSEHGFTTQIQIDFFRWILGLVGIGFIITIVLLLEKKKIINNKLRLVICNIGQVTLQIYILQRIIVEKIAGHLYQHIINQLGG